MPNIHCPYCVSDIAEAARVCPVCRHDLQLVKALNEKIAALEAQLASAAAQPAAAEAAEPEAAAEVEAVAPNAWWSALAACVLPIVLLLIAHLLLVMVYDVRLVYLRLVALVLPLPFGYLYARAVRFSFAQNMGVALPVAFASVVGMSAITAWFDQVPVLPQNILELREFLEFATSIGFSFVTGLWLQAWARRRAEDRAHRELQLRLAGGSKKIAESLSSLNDLGHAAVAFTTTAFSIYTGLKGVLGS